MMLKIGQKVSWVSQSAGFTKKKSGEIEAIIYPNTRPDKALFPGLYASGAGPGGRRKEVSYVVRVGKKLYWPKTKYLKECDENSALAEGLKKVKRVKKPTSYELRAIEFRIYEGDDDLPKIYSGENIVLASGKTFPEFRRSVGEYMKNEMMDVLELNGEEITLQAKGTVAECTITKLTPSQEKEIESIKY